ncbi:hypothetical protein ACH4SP_22605 [Streptomyces sp. NPDC021093]|uniref:hypothetical protein n=1 Tax=Streptomyces sp. NPDC021093 TaxID=3365112 RepID=UPI0037918D1A
MMRKISVSWPRSYVAVALGLAAMLVAGWLLGSVVPQKVLAGRAYETARSCPAGEAGAAARDCLSSARGTLERTWKGEGRNPRAHAEVVTADGRRLEFRLDDGEHTGFAPKGTAVLLVSWRGEVRHLNYTPAGATHTVFTDANPRTAHGGALAWGLGLAFGGAGFALLGLQGRRYEPGGSRAGEPEPMFLQPAQVPALMLIMLGICAGVLASYGDPVGTALKRTGWMAAGAVVVGALMALYLRVRPARPTGPVTVAPRRPDRDRTFPVRVLGDTSGPGGHPRHSHLVAGPGGLLAYTNDPTGAFRREELPPGLVLEQVRHWHLSDPTRPLNTAEAKDFRVVQLRDGDRELLLAVHRRQAPWVLGALETRRDSRHPAPPDGR